MHPGKSCFKYPGSNSIYEGCVRSSIIMSRAILTRMRSFALVVYGLDRSPALYPFLMKRPLVLALALLRAQLSFPATF